MASVSKRVSTDQKTVLREVQFVGLDGERKTIRLGSSCSERDANGVAGHVEEIINSAELGRPLLLATEKWLANMPPKMEKKLVKVGLIHPREATAQLTLSEFLKRYLARRSDVKAGTQTFYGHTVRNLLDVFGAERPLASITAGDADDFRRHLSTEHDWQDEAGQQHKKKPLSAATVARRCSLARTIFKDAVRRKLLTENPFDDVVGGPSHNPERQHFIDRATITKVLDACPNAEWRLLVALSRFGGVRIPSEALTLRWCDIDWSANRMTIHSPKTEHHVGKAKRVVPIFTELRPYLEDVFDPAAEFVLTGLQHEAGQRGDWRAVNVRTRFQKIIKRAGVDPWPRLWHNLRASRQTELEEQFPSHVVCAWLGNSEAIARKHYLQVRETDFQKATQEAQQKAQQHTAASGEFETHRATRNEETPRFRRVTSVHVGDTGFEPVTSTV